MIDVAGDTKWVRKQEESLKFQKWARVQISHLWGEKNKKQNTKKPQANRNMTVGCQFAQCHLMLLFHKVAMQGIRNYKSQGILKI